MITEEQTQRDAQNPVDADEVARLFVDTLFSLPPRKRRELMERFNALVVSNGREPVYGEDDIIKACLVKTRGGGA